MCDTLVAVGDATADGSVILAKNSDRQPNEAHVLTQIPRARRHRRMYVYNSPPGARDLRRAAIQALLDLGLRDGGQRVRRLHRQ